MAGSASPGGFKRGTGSTDEDDMGVINGFRAPWQRTLHAAVDLEGARLFLRAQTLWLVRGVERADDPAALGIVLGSHDACHETWLALVAGADHHAGPEAAEAVAALYAFHGRVVGWLERGVVRRLPPDVSRRLRRMLVRQLRELTDAAEVALGIEDARSRTGPPGAVTGRRSGGRCTPAQAVG
jgi:hypothetical protein